MRLALLPALAFAALAALVAAGATRGLDLATTRAFQSVASYPLDVAVNAHTVLGLLNVTLPLAAILCVVVWRRRGGYAWLAPALVLATGAVELAFKYAVAHPGPPAEFVRAFAYLGPPPEWRPPYSFPSGHMARLTFLSVVAAALFPSRALLVLGAAFVAFSLFARVYIGDHWISDALGGLLLGSGIGVAAVAWMKATARR